MRLHPYQVQACKHIIDNPAAGLFLSMGTGKTAATLKALDQLLNETFEITRVLVIAPKFVARTVWTAEIAKWYPHLKASVVLGTARQRADALRKKADIYIINRENVDWLVSFYGARWDFDMVIIDELSSFKSASARRFRALRTVRPLIKRIVGLTGTPAPNGVSDLWPQLYLLDQGKRLGKTLTAFREAYLTPDKRDAFRVFSYKPREGAEAVIYKKIADICISMKAADYLQLPGRIEHEVVIDLEPETLAGYESFERDQVMALEGQDITALNAGVLAGKLLQYSNGAVYDAERTVHKVHDQKLEALEELVEEASGNQVLIFYNFLHDRDRILERLPGARQLKTAQDIIDWNAGKVGVMVAHPASAGHGLNLQAGGNIIIWFGLPWSLELYEQANARLDRQGQTRPVVIFKLLSGGTLDQSVASVLERKAGGQAALLEAVKAKIYEYKRA